MYYLEAVLLETDMHEGIGITINDSGDVLVHAVNAFGQTLLLS